MGSGTASKELGQPVSVTRNGRRYFSRSHKQRVVEACLAPGASVAAVALSYGFNANLVRRWIRQHQSRARADATLVPVVMVDSLAASSAPLTSNPSALPRSADKVIEIEYAGARIVVNGVIDGTVLRELLETLARHR
jgi:transposase